ncbi:tetratricopeptide repeat protein [Brevibacillus reuszeri]|uniref:tetratricopeptide repeat protein n=1 Tax=Brevibacillus reuszeri TaxID=54915 RepID=UPI0028A08066|nr:tetratricopeptide repeat protein [Brevibacillus reuszeri]
MMFAQRMKQGMELSGESFHKVAHLFASLSHHLSIRGVITGVLPGRVFLTHDGTAAILTSPQGIFFGGSSDNKLFLNEAALLLKEELLPQLATEEQLDYVLFYPQDGLWETALEAALQELLPMKSGRMTYRHDLINQNEHLEEDIVPVNASFLKRQDLVGLDDLISEILQGWARKAALGALTLAKQRGMTSVGWQCWSSNIGSQKTALSVGFKLEADFSVLFGWNRPLNNLLVNGNHYMRGDQKYGVEKDYARAARCYAEALDQGWDWNGNAALYWNAACLFYLLGEMERAVHYYRTAVEKGWIDFLQPHYHDCIYREENSEEIRRILAESI